MLSACCGMPRPRAVSSALGGRSVRLAVLSADAMPEQIDAATRAGFERYWTKPVDLSALMACLDETLA